MARVEFVNPSDATDQPWDFGIAFREQDNGDHYRVTVASDGSWEYQIGLQADLAGGTVPSLSFEKGGRNVLEVVVAGDSAGFSVNGVFVSELKPILQLPYVDRALNFEAVRHLFTFLVTPPSQSIVEGVKKLEPATAGTVALLCAAKSSCPRVGPPAGTAALAARSTSWRPSA